MTHARHLASVSLVTLAIALAAPLASLPALADAPLSGAITSATGERMGGVTVSAKAEGATITTSVYTDASGNYYFPPLPEGNYRVWAQAVQFETARNNVTVGQSRQQNFVLKPITDREAWIRQLPGDEFLAALPGETPEDFRMKTQVRKNCTGCHSASYALQHRFDEEGWSKILDLMKQVNVNGTYPRPDKRLTPNIDFHQQDLAKYLARARGPGESSMRFNLQPRPSGEAARIVVKEYDFPSEDNHLQTNDGTDWMLGTPSESGHMAGVHDAAADLDGNIWIVYSRPSRVTSYARIDAKTGAVKHFTIPDRRGIVAGSHGIVRDENGILWFNIRSHVERRHGGLAKLDPKTEKLDIYVPPTTMSGTSGTIDADMKGNIWVTSADGALHFNIKEERFTEYKSVTYKNKHGIATVYGLAADCSRQRLVAADEPGPRQLQRHRDRQGARIQAAGGTGRGREPHAATGGDVRDLHPAGLQRAVRLGAGRAADGRRQERQPRLDRQFLRRQPGARRHQHQAGHAGAVPEPGGAPALPGERRQQPQCVDPPVEHRQGRQVQSGDLAMDAVRAAQSRHRVASSLAAGA